MGTVHILYTPDDIARLFNTFDLHNHLIIRYGHVFNWLSILMALAFDEKTRNVRSI